MSGTDNKGLGSIFDNQDFNDLKERQRLEELKRQAKIQQIKLDKRLTKQKILMGSFLGQVLVTEGPDEKIIQDYFAIHFPEFLTRKADKELFKTMIEGLGGDVGLEENQDWPEDKTPKSESPIQSGQQVYSNNDNRQEAPDLLSDNRFYSADTNY